MNLVYGIIVLINAECDISPRSEFFGCQRKGKLVDIVVDIHNNKQYTVRYEGCEEDKKISRSSYDHGEFYEKCLTVYNPLIHK